MPVKPCSCTARRAASAWPPAGRGGAVETIAVVSTDAKAEVARANRATHTVPVDGFKDRVLELTGGRGVDIVSDPSRQRSLHRCQRLRSLAPNGRVVVLLGFTGGEIPTVKVNRLLLRNTSVVGAGWGEYVRTFPTTLPGSGRN